MPVLAPLAKPTYTKYLTTRPRVADIHWFSGPVPTLRGAFTVYVVVRAVYFVAAIPVVAALASTLAPLAAMSPSSLGLHLGEGASHGRRYLRHVLHHLDRG